MNVFAVAVFVHLFSAVLLTGSVLFWVVMAKALKQEVGETEAEGHLSIINREWWPPVKVPDFVRWPLVGWAGFYMLVLVASGVLIMELLVSSPGLGLEDPSFGSWFDKTLHVKFMLTGGLIAGLVAMAKAPRLWLAYFNGLTLVGIIVLSALLGR